MVGRGGRRESFEEDDVVDEDAEGRFGSGGRGVSSDEDDEDVEGRFGSGGRGESSEDEEPIGRNAHSAMPLSFGARGQ